MGPGKVSANACVLLEMINSYTFIRCVTGMVIEINRLSEPQRSASVFLSA